MFCFQIKTGLKKPENLLSYMWKGPYQMKDLKIKEVSRFVEDNIEKTRLIISENGRDTEIILTGNGKLKVAVSAK